jgi:hypothetical protein
MFYLSLLTIELFIKLLWWVKMSQQSNIIELEIKNEVLLDIEQKLRSLLVFKIRSGSKAYNELDLFLYEIINTRKKIKDEILNFEKLIEIDIHIEYRLKNYNINNK